MLTATNLGSDEELWFNTVVEKISNPADMIIANWGPT